MYWCRSVFTVKAVFLNLPVSETFLVLKSTYVEYGLLGESFYVSNLQFSDY